jgi:hypothetical protein
MIILIEDIKTDGFGWFTSVDDGDVLCSHPRVTWTFDFSALQGDY